VPVDLPALAAPRHTAVVVSEMKRITVGDLVATNSPTSPGAPLAAAGAELGLVDNVARLLHAARAAGVTVVHTTSAFREDGVGSPPNAPLLASALRHRHHLLEGSEQAEPAHEVFEPGDVWQARHHGLGPFLGTGLDPLLRSLEVTTVVLVGGSVNVGIPAAAIEAVDLGYRAVIPRDGVVGVPADFVEQAFEHQLRYVAWITTVDDLVAVWR
jgi:nicotinamidase-related amidase